MSPDGPFPDETGQEHPLIIYFLRALRARLRSSPSLDVLTVLGVALGVASVLSIQILNANALGAFQGSVRALSGEADLTVSGHLPTLPEELYLEVLTSPGVAAAWPLIRQEVALAGRDDLRLTVVGFDLFAPVQLPFQEVSEDLAGALARPGWVAVTPALAVREGWSVGDALTVTRGDVTATLVVGALVDFQRISPLASSKLAVMDIAQAQSLLGTRGRIHQIDVQAAPGMAPALLAARLQERLGPTVRLVTPEQREQEAARFLGPFRLNLTALSLISLLVGMFLVHESVQAALLRRRQELGLLRSLGSTRGQVLRLILTEVALVGALGVALGLPLGYGVAVAGLEGVSETVSNLYLLEEMETLTLSPWTWVLAGLVGVGGAVLAALRPALDMTRRDTWSLLAAFTVHRRADSQAPRLFVAGALLPVVVGGWYAALGRGWRPAGFVLAVAVVLAVPLVTPLLVRGVSRAARVHGFGLGYSLRSLGQRLQTTSLAVSALAVAVTMLVGVTFMVGGFRVTVDRWVASTVQADIYITGASWRQGDAGATLSPEHVARLAAWPGVRAVDRLRRMDMVIDTGRVSLMGLDMALAGGEVRFGLRNGDAAAAMRRAHREGAVLLGEPLAQRLQLGVGELLRLPGPEGMVELPVAGVYYDYSAGAGSAAMDLAAMERLYGPGRPHNLALYLEEGLDAEAVVEQIKAGLAGVPLRIRSNRRLRSDVLKIFDQTFAVTRILQGMGLLIAVAGITLTLLVLARQQVSELALYRALGARRRQIFRVYVGKGLGMAMVGLLLGTGAGVVLAWVLTFVINPDYFGWTVQFHWQWGDLGLQAAAVLVAAVMASVYPALRASRTPASELSREEVA